MKISRPFVLIAVLVVALIASLGFLAHALWQNQMWEMQVYGLAGYQGASRARQDFQAGRLRLFVIAGERSDDKFSGTNDGPFEIWYPQYFPQYHPFRYSAEQMVKFYNDKMRYMHEHPEKFVTATNTEAQKAGR